MLTNCAEYQKDFTNEEKSTIYHNIIVLLSLFGCTKKKNLDERVLNLYVSAKIKGMDPIYANDMYSSNEVARVYEGTS